MSGSWAVLACSLALTPCVSSPLAAVSLSSASFPQSASWPPGPSHSGSVSYAGAQNSALHFLKDLGAFSVCGGRAQPLFSLTFSTWSPQLAVVYSLLVPPSLVFSSTSHPAANLPARLGQGPFSGPQFPFLDKEEDNWTGVVTAITKISHACCNTSDHSTIRNV